LSRHREHLVYPGMVAELGLDAENALRDGLRSAFEQIRVLDADENALRIVRYAALLTPDDNQPPISTSRLFAGVVGVGLALQGSRSYPAALARAITRDASLKASYDRVLALFETEPADSALARLGPQWFSRNVMGILQNAMKDEGHAPFSEAIARALLAFRDGLIYGRISMDQVRSIMAAEVDDPWRQIDQQLFSLQISVTPQIRELLLHAAEMRSSSEPLGPALLYQALREAGRGTERPVRRTDPSALLFAALEVSAGPEMPAAT
jgi:hypothetical protein